MLDLMVYRLLLRRDSVDPSQWPSLTCTQANEATLEVSNLRLGNQKEILFQDNGQVRSFDNNHKLVFNRASNLLELHEFGDIRFLTGGAPPTEKMRILANGNVGIGTATPFTKLHIVSAAGADHFGYGNPMLFGQHIELAASRMWGLFGLYGLLHTWDSDSLFIGLKDEGPNRKDAIIAFGDDPQDTLRFMFTLPGDPPPPPLELMRITADGNVGIGAIPGAKLTVAGIIESKNGGFKFPDGTIQTTAGGGGASQWITSGNDLYYDKGNVGVGTSGPQSRLHVKTKGNGWDDHLVLEGVDNSDHSKWQFLVDSGSANRCRIRNKGSGQEALTIQTDGNIGISTPTPNFRLDVNGIINATDFFKNGVPFKTSQWDDVTGGINYSGGNVGIGVTQPVEKLAVNGKASANSYKASQPLGRTDVPDIGGVYADNVLHAWAFVDSDGDIHDSFGIQSVNRAGQGVYDIIYLRNFSPQGTPVPIATSLNQEAATGGAPEIAVIAGSNSNGCQIRIFQLSSGRPSPRNSSFYFLVFGRPQSVASQISAKKAKKLR